MSVRSLYNTRPKISSRHFPYNVVHSVCVKNQRVPYEFTRYRNIEKFLHVWK